MAMTLSRKQAADLASDSTDFDALFRQQWERLCRMLFYMLGDWDEAQDLALEAFERLHRRPPADTTNLPAWLYRTATNLGYNALRARKRRVHYETQADAPFGAVRTAPDPAAVVEQRIERRRVRRVLSEMKPRSASLLMLRYSGLSYAEVAAALDIAPASVGTLLARAEAEFEKLYRREAGPHEDPQPPSPL